MDTSKPLFTFFIYAFNHEKFIREAIEGAFSQTYQPIEIILSDDCSTDNTWAIMQEMANDYKGPHRIILNRNEKNLGITAHINKIMQIGSGEWFVLGAGDDISQSDRIQTIYDSIKKHPNAYGVATELLNIDVQGRETGYHHFDKIKPYVTGASSAWHRKCFDYFGEITQDSTAEDAIIPFRAVLLGELLLLKTPTVKYRYHEQSISNPLNQDLIEAWKHVEKIKYQLINACQQRLCDLGKAKQLLSSTVHEELGKAHKELIKEFESDIENINLRCRIWDADWTARLSYLLGRDKDMPDKHLSFYYRLKTVLAASKIVQFILQSKKSAKRNLAVEQEAQIRALKIDDLLNSEIGLLIYL